MRQWTAERRRPTRRRILCTSILSLDLAASKMSFRSRTRADAKTAAPRKEPRTRSTEPSLRTMLTMALSQTRSRCSPSPDPRTCMVRRNGRRRRTKSEHRGFSVTSSGIERGGNKTSWCKMFLLDLKSPPRQSFALSCFPVTTDIVHTTGNTLACNEKDLRLTKG